MWKSQTKEDLMIEVWEFLDCESIGKLEILEIQRIVGEKFTQNAVLSPMKTARLLADEGAELRHSEIMELAVAQMSDSPYDPMFRNIFDFSGFKQALKSIRYMENLRRKFLADRDKEGLRLLRKYTVEEKAKIEHTEIGEWLRIWLQTPEIFETWAALRTNSPDFKQKFGDLP